MNRGSLILINTAKDLLKQDGCEILGRFFLALIAQATQERAALPEERRRATFLYIDEAQDYFDEGMEQLLNQARKYRVGLVLAHQNLGQFEPRLQASVMASTAIVTAQVPQRRSGQSEVCNQALGIAGQGLEQVPALLPRGREERADHGEVFGTSLGAEAA